MLYSTVFYLVVIYLLQYITMPLTIFYPAAVQLGIDCAVQTVYSISLPHWAVQCSTLASGIILYGLYSNTVLDIMYCNNALLYSTVQY